MYCKSCGTEVASSYKLCPKCGQRDFSSTKNPPAGQSAMPTMVSSSPPRRNLLSNIGIQQSGLLWVVGGVIAIVLALLAIKAWEGAKADAEVRKQEELARIEIDRKRNEMNLEFERQKREKEIAEAAEKARQADEEARQRKDYAARVSAAREAIQKIEKSVRPSMLDSMKGTSVLQLRNIRSVSVAFDLKCCTTQRGCKTLFVTIQPQSTVEIGWLEGWSGNFVPNETCEASYQDEILWKVVIPD